MRGKVAKALRRASAQSGTDIKELKRAWVCRPAPVVRRTRGYFLARKG